MEGEQSMKSILFINILIAAVVIVSLALQVVQMARTSNLLFLEDDIKVLQDKIDKIATTTPSQMRQTMNGTPQPTGVQGTQQPLGGAPQSIGAKCGDGTCDAVEKERGVCPTDCK